MGRADQLPHIRDTSADLRRHLDTFSTPSSHLVVDTRDTLDTLSHVAQQLVTHSFFFFFSEYNSAEKPT